MFSLKGYETEKDLQFKRLLCPYCGEDLAGDKKKETK